MKSIKTLVPDIYELVKTKGWMTDEVAKEFGQAVARRVQSQFTEQGPARLRLSQMGPRCGCALWHSIHNPQAAESLPPWAQVKYSYGHILEGLSITLAKASGHTVELEQETVYVDGVAGHIDCLLDGMVVDFKSTTSRSFQKFKDGSIAEDDPFGYLDQLDGYLLGLSDNPLLVVKDRAAIFAVDKQLGHMVIYEHTGRPDRIRSRVAESKRVVGLDSPPECSCGTIPDGKSGNVRLDVKASYSPYKYCCRPTLRTFLYSDGPRYLVKVERKPDVPEIDRTGRIVYN